MDGYEQEAAASSCAAIGKAPPEETYRRRAALAGQSGGLPDESSPEQDEDAAADAETDGEPGRRGRGRWVFSEADRPEAVEHRDGTTEHERAAFKKGQFCQRGHE